MNVAGCIHSGMACDMHHFLLWCLFNNKMVFWAGSRLCFYCISSTLPTIFPGRGELKGELYDNYLESRQKVEFLQGWGVKVKCSHIITWEASFGIVGSQALRTQGQEQPESFVNLSRWHLNEKWENSSFELGRWKFPACVARAIAEGEKKKKHEARLPNLESNER